MKTITYTPYVFSPTPFLQFFFYLTAEVFVQKFSAPTYVREEFTLKDGGLMALDWTVDSHGSALPELDSNQRSKQPIMIIVPGLSGKNDNLYCISVINKARKMGFKCCTVIFRGCEGLPLKTPVLSYPSHHEDMEESVNYVFEKYIKEPKTGRYAQKLVAYGVSLGAMFLGNYLV